MLSKVKQIKNWLENLTIVKNDIFVYTAIFIMIAGFMINGVIIQVVKGISMTVYNVFDIALLVIEGAIICGALLTILIKKPKKIFFTYLFFLAIFLFNYTLFKENNTALLAVFPKFILYDVTALVLFYFIKKDERLLKFCITCAKVLFAFSVVYLLLTLSKASYDVWLAKHFFIVSIFTLYGTYKYHTKHTLIIHILCLIALLYTGSRTYILLYIIYTGIYAIIAIIKWLKKAKITGKIVFTIIVIAIFLLSIFIINNYKTLSRELYVAIYRDFRVKVRMLHLLYSEDSLFTSTSRTEGIYPIIQEAIRSNWLAGNGLCSDRQLVYQKYLEEGKIKAGYPITAYYSHNFILEVICDFGVFGILMIGLLVYLLWWNLAKQKNKRDIIICLSMASIFPLMLNGTFLDNILFWGLVGVLISDFFKEHNIKMNIKTKELGKEGKFIKEILFAVIFKLLLDIAYLVVLQKTANEYYYPEFNIIKWTCSIFAVIALCALVEKIENSFTKFLVKIVFAMGIIPISTLYSVKNYNTIHYLAIILGFVITISTIYLLPKLINIIKGKIATKHKEIKVSKINVSQIIYYAFIINTIVVFFACIICNGIFSFTALNLNRVYEIRKEFVLPHYITYLFQFETKFIIPFLLVLFLHKKKYVRAIMTILLQVMFFLWKGDKFTLFTIPVIIAIYYIFKYIKRNEDTYIIPTFSGITLTTGIIGMINIKIIMPFSLLVRRLLLVPANLKFLYFDFFTQNPKIGIVGTILNFFLKRPSVYEQIPYQNLIAGQYLGEYEMYSNTGVLAEGFARWGYIGIPIIAIILGIVILVITYGTKKNPKEFIAGIAIIPIIGLNDGYLLPSLLFGSILLLLIVCFGVRVENIKLIFDKKGKMSCEKNNNVT